MNLLLKLSLSQSILITIFALWGGVPCQHIPASVSGSFASLVQNGGRNSCHFISDVLLQDHRCPWFLFVHIALESAILRGRSHMRWDREILQAIQYSLFLRSCKLRTSRSGLAVWAVAPSCWKQRVWFSTTRLYKSSSRNVRSISV